MYYAIEASFPEPAEVVGTVKGNVQPPIFVSVIATQVGSQRPSTYWRHCMRLYRGVDGLNRFAVDERALLVKHFR